MLDKSLEDSSYSKKPKCARRGRKVRNSFLMFLREYRTKHCGKSMPQLSREAARIWNCMSSSEKGKYRNEV